MVSKVAIVVRFSIFKRAFALLHQYENVWGILIVTVSFAYCPKPLSPSS